MIATQPGVGPGQCPPELRESLRNMDRSCRQVRKMITAIGNRQPAPCYTGCYALIIRPRTGLRHSQENHLQAACYVGSQESRLANTDRDLRYVTLGGGSLPRCEPGLMLPDQYLWVGCRRGGWTDGQCRKPGVAGQGGEAGVVGWLIAVDRKDGQCSEEGVSRVGMRRRTARWLAGGNREARKRRHAGRWGNADD